MITGKNSDVSPSIRRSWVAKLVSADACYGQDDRRSSGGPGAASRICWQTEALTYAASLAQGREVQLARVMRQLIDMNLTPGLGSINTAEAKPSVIPL
jgi:hypothetical protein